MHGNLEKIFILGVEIKYFSPMLCINKYDNIALKSRLAFQV